MAPFDFVPIREIGQYLEESASLQGALERGETPIPTAFSDLDQARWVPTLRHDKVPAWARARWP